LTALPERAKLFSNEFPAVAFNPSSFFPAAHLTGSGIFAVLQPSGHGGFFYAFLLRGSNAV
jgi:hypothetical protein